MKKQELKEIIRQEILSENTKALSQAYKVYSASVVAFEEMANKLKDSRLVKWSRELNNLHGKVLDHLDDSYPGSVDESVKDVYRQNLPSASYHELEIGEMGLRSLVKNTGKDKDLIKFSKAHQKIMTYVKAHLHNEYPDWERGYFYEGIRNSKKSKANLEKALKKYKKGATVHYFPLSGGNYVVVGPKGVKTKDDGPVVVKIRKVGTLDADNPNQVSVGIDLNNGHSATWNGKEFEVEDLGVPLKLGKG